MTSTSLTSLLAGMSSIGLFASRAFVSAFTIAAALKWGPEIGWLRDTGLLERVTGVPTWFTHDLTVGVLGILALLEVLATKSPDARELLEAVDGYLKSAMAFLTTLGVMGLLTAEDREVIEQIMSWQEPARAGLGEQVAGWIGAVIAAGGVWFACIVRRSLLGDLVQADPDDDTMIAGMLSWLEDIWAVVGALLLILLPVVMLVITAVLMGIISLLHWRAKRREQKSQVPCAGCGQPRYRCAVRCPNCQAPNTELHAVGWLGQSTDRPPLKPALQPVRLTQKQRCPECATHLKPRQTDQGCPACGHDLFSREEARTAYLHALDVRLPTVMAVTAMLSLIPVVGLIPAIMVYRLKLIAPLRRYLTMSRRVPMGIGLRLLFIVLIWVQLIPVVGVAAVPLMAFISYGAYRRQFSKQLAADRPLTLPATAPAPSSGA